jgi:hypothetical protein
VEYEGVLRCVEVFAFHEGYGVVTPMSERVQVVGGVVAVVEAMAVALMVRLCSSQRAPVTYSNIDKGHAGPVIRVWLFVIHKSVLSPISHHQTDTKQ